MSGFCGLWLFFLGLAAPLALYAIAAFARDLGRAQEVSPARRDFRIMYLTPMCVRALGRRCTNLARLAALCPDCIGERLSRFPFPETEPSPTREQYSSWPDQAALILAGKWEELHALQEALGDRLGRPSSWDDRSSDEAQPRKVNYLIWLPALASVLLLVSSIIIWLLVERSGHCSCIIIPPPDSSPKVVTVELSTDMIFDYNRPQATGEVWRSSFHEENAKAQLRRLFSGFGGITISTIAAHTDPIGGEDENQALGRRRAAAVARLIDIIKGEANQNISFAQQRSSLASISPSGPEQSESKFWKFCFEKYYLSQPMARPLKDLDERHNREHRTVCHLASADTVYPACARINVPPSSRRPPAGYAQASENLRELTECLAPMRHVAITFRFQRVLPISSSVQP